MRKLNNPYEKYEDHHCFACSPRNDHGLKMEFYEDGDEIVSEWIPGIDFQGYVSMLHGGIQATLIDEIAIWLIQVKAKTAGVTSSLKVRYLKPVLMTNEKIVIRASMKELNRKLATVTVKLSDDSGQICSEGEVVYYLFDKSAAIEKLNYPGNEAFFSE